MEKVKEKEITYEDLENKTKKELKIALEHGHNDNYVNAKNLSETLVNILKRLR